MATHSDETARRDPESGSSVLSSFELNLVLDRLVDGVMVLGFDWRIRYLNASAATMLGTTPDRLEGTDIRAEFPEVVGHPFHVAFAEAMRTGRPLRMVGHYEPLGRWFETRAFPEGDRIINLFRDVTGEREAEEALRERIEEFSEAERIVHFGVWKWDLTRDRLHWSDELQRIYGLRPGTFPGTVAAFRELVHPDDLEQVWTEVTKALESPGPFAFREKIIRPDGQVRTLFSQGRVIVDGVGAPTAMVGICHDITSRVATQEALGASEERLRSIIEHTPALIAVKDLEGRFVMSNAEAERIAGATDEGLVGKICVDVFPGSVGHNQRAHDRMALRTGGPVYDEVVLRSEGSDRTFLTVTFPLPDKEGALRETCTIATDVTERRREETALAERERSEDQIFSALREDRMVVFGQPIYRLGDGSRWSSELLVRLRRPGDPMVIEQPRSFLATAERFGFVQEIDVWMVEQAIRLGGEERVQVNLSAVTVCDPDAQARVLDLIGRAPTVAENVVFEITETASATRLRAAQEFATALIEHGCALALDDFGVGFGSFTYLRSLPLTYVKIDMSFVSGLLTSADDRRVIRGIVKIAHEFGLETIAEGVEDQETLDALGEIGVDLAQGYLLGAPAPVSR